MSGLHFTQEVDGWRWHRIAANGGLATNSAHAFASLLDCLNDATKTGYALSPTTGTWTAQRLPGV